MISASRYILNGSPHHCAFCREPLRETAHRRDSRYFCNELCADAAPQQPPQREARPQRPQLYAGAPILTIAA